jgi:hypothetical protein
LSSGSSARGSIVICAVPRGSFFLARCAAMIPVMGLAIVVVLVAAALATVPSVIPIGKVEVSTLPAAALPVLPVARENHAEASC